MSGCGHLSPESQVSPRNRLAGFKPLAPWPTIWARSGCFSGLSFDCQEQYHSPRDFYKLIPLPYFFCNFFYNFYGNSLRPPIFFVTPMRSSGSRVDWKIFFVSFAKLIPRNNFFCIAKILVLMVDLDAREIPNSCLWTLQGRRLVYMGKKKRRFGSFFVLSFLALGGHCLQMLCLPGFGTHANTHNLTHFSCFPDNPYPLN